MYHRLTISLVLLVVGLPVFAPVTRALGEWPREPGRVAGLTLTTLTLAALAVSIALIPGIAWGMSLARAGRFGWALVAAGAAVPLCVQAIAWQAAGGGLLDWAARTPGDPAAWRPWRAGLLPAAFVHGMAGVPAIAVVVGLMLRSVDPRLIEVAILEAGWMRAARRVFLPRILLGATAGAAWVALQAATEIPVTDAMQVRTAAEEVYTQFATRSTGESAAALTLPFALIAWSLLAVVAWRIGPRLARPGGVVGVWPQLPAAWRGGIGLIATVAIVGALGIPIAALMTRAARGGGLWTSLEVAARTEGPTLAGSLGAALGAGCLAATLAALAAWDARQRPHRVKWWVALALFVAVTPGPVVGLGLQIVIGAIIDCERSWIGRGLLDEVLYSGPSPVPAVWACVARFFPVALAVLLPRALVIPSGLLDQAQLDGIGVRQTLRRVALPALAAAWAVAGLGVAALALGEVSASRLVDPPGRATFSLRLFSQMHYGAESAVAAMALLQIAAITAVAGVLAPSRR